MEEKSMLAIAKNASRKEVNATFGSWFCKDKSASELIKDVDSRLERLEVWKENLETLKQELADSVCEERLDEFKEYIKVISPEKQEQFKRAMFGN